MATPLSTSICVDVSFELSINQVWCGRSAADWQDGTDLLDEPSNTFHKPI